MADTSFITKKQQPLLKEHNPSRFYTHFLFKALLVIIFCIILPIFTSQTPEFSDQKIILELLHLIFVGIAVSYGLFSRRNHETVKENNNDTYNNQSKFENAHSYMSKFLQVSSVFDEENENESESSDEGKFQTWSNRYYRNEPEVVLSKDESVLGPKSRTNAKPLLLPVRSLKSRLLDSNSFENTKDFSGSFSMSGSNSRSKRFSRNSSEESKTGEVSGYNDRDRVDFSDVSQENNIVLPSPIPWRSRSGKMELKEIREEKMNSPLNPSLEDADFSRVESRPPFKPQMPHFSRSKSASSSPNLTPSSSLNSSPRKLSPLSAFFSESIEKSAEDFVRTKRFFGACPPSKKNLPPIYTSEPKDFYKDSEEDLVRPRAHQVEGLSSMGWSSKTIRSSDSIIGATRDRVVEKGFKESLKKNDGFDQEISNKTERVHRERMSSYLPNKGSMEFRKGENLEFIEKRVTESHGDENVYIDYDEEDDEGVDDTGASSLASRILRSLDKEKEVVEEEEEVSGSSSASDDEPDVDKKADEFIAKFREQIRLQRIESIKRFTTAQIRRNSSR